MIKSGEIDNYSFRNNGPETIKINGKTFETIKFEVIRDPKKERHTYFWMVPNLAYLPVKLEHYELGHKQIDIKIIKYHFEKK